MEFPMNPNEGATDNRRKARPSSLAENGGDGSPEKTGDAVKVGEWKRHGRSVKRDRPWSME
jgi:hypothetical protein